MDHPFLSWAEIDLDAISWNVRAIRRHVGENVEVMPAVKANAYGHGVLPVSRAALQAGATRLAVHRLSEGVELRRGGISAPVLLMGYTPPAGAEEVVRWQLTPSVMNAEFCCALSVAAVSAGIEVPVHIKVDTGMNRYGLLPDEVLDFLRFARSLPGIILEGIFTHFATADSLDQTHIRKQLSVFNDVLSALTAAAISIPFIHTANSGAIMRLPEGHFNLVRPGIAFYGMHPSSEWPPVFEIHPALALKSRIVRLRKLPVGAGISYGRTYITEKPTLAALVPVGYGDGYHRILSNRSQVLVRGQRAPLLGRVCMDQFVIDVTHIQGVKMDDEVCLLGYQAGSHISAEEVATWAGTINYEITTSLLPRVHRIFKQSGEVLEIQTAVGI